MVTETDSYRAPLDIVVSIGSTVNIAQWCITPIGHLDSFAGAAGNHQEVAGRTRKVVKVTDSYRTSLDEVVTMDVPVNIVQRDTFPFDRPDRS